MQKMARGMCGASSVTSASANVSPRAAVRQRPPRPRPAAPLGGVPAVSRPLWLEARALLVGHLADDQRAVLDLFVDAVELGLALLRLSLPLGLGGHGIPLPARGSRHTGPVALHPVRRVPAPCVG